MHCLHKRRLLIILLVYSLLITMVAKTTRQVFEIGRNKGRVMVLPKDFCEGMDIQKGTILTVYYGDVALIAPPGTEELAARLVKAMREDR